MSESPLRISLRLPHSYAVAGPKAIRQVAEAAEAYGFYGVSVQDHILVDPKAAPCGGDGDNRNLYEALQTLGWVAGVTERVKLITTVLVAGFRHPVMLAKETASLDALSGGRLMVGVGVGAGRTRQSAEGFKLAHHATIATREFDALNVMGHRGKLADENLQILDAMWTQDSASFHGEIYQFEDMDAYPKPVQRPRPPLLVGGRSEAAIRRAALLADGWCPSHESPQHFAENRLKCIAIATAAGKPAPKWWGTNIDLAVARTDEKAQDLMGRWFGKMFETRQAMVDATLTGTPETILRQLGVWRRAGLNLADVKITPRDLDETLEQMRILGEEVIPALPGLDAELGPDTRDSR
ncbi:LLM class flavin-dependent oxidoreductase [Rhizohabitans arisaemae]|uniref:LLM class flavin-dependent oxidoreductase n=1 Tax=Rhizohabitans arisaemae TaxID=2720610 RepID=UPI0024B04D58|nr:TIGR03619 family F420-dependent LLM class oxidoreductase [Rhizohabitans arisaemae]